MSQEIAYSKSPFARRLFSVFIISAALPIAILAVITLSTVSEQLLEQNATRQAEQAKTFGLSIYDRLDLLDRELQLLDTINPLLLRNKLSKVESPRQKQLLEKLDSLWLWYSEEPQSEILGQALPIDEDLIGAIGANNSSSLIIHSSGSDYPAIVMALKTEGSENDHAILFAAINPDYLWGTETFEVNQDYCVFESSGQVLYCSNEETIRTLESNEFDWTGFSGNHEFLNSNQEVQLVSYWSIFLNGRFSVDDWMTLINIPKSDVLTPINDFQIVFIAVLFITLLIVILISNAQIRRILDPLRRLTAATKALGNSDFSNQLVIDSRDEFSELASSFNAMGKKLSDQFQSLQTMAEIDRLILASQDADQVVQIVISRIRQIVHCSVIGITVKGQDGKFETMSLGTSTCDGPGDAKKLDIELSATDLEFLHEHKQGKLVEIGDCDLSMFDHFHSYGIKACLVLPLHIDDSLSAVIVLGYFVKPEFPEKLIKETKSWTDRVAVALSNAKWQEKLFKQANYDVLTGLANRPAFRNHLKNVLSRAKRNNEFVGILFIDLDRFKLVNDTLGHAAGDQFLSQIATRLSNCIRSSDLLARLGGDEFTIVISESPTHADIKNSITTIADKLLREIPEPITLRKQEFRTNASIGISIFPLDGDNIDDLMKNADSAMYHAKKQDGGTYHFYSEDLNKAVSDQLRIENDIRLAIQHDEFELYYQPQIQAATGIACGAEALIRWNHKKDGLISPGLFIPLAEESQLIVEIDKWVLNAACLQLRKWKAQNRPLVRIAVNLSARFFRQHNVVEILEVITSRHEIDPSLLELEITEGTLIEDIESAIGVLQQLAESGYELTIDDFGTGYSSLTYLKKLPIHKLKIDKSFVDNCSTDKIDASLVVTIINMAKTLELICIAEGVEMQEQFDFLKLHDCAEIQGYFFSKPKPAEEFATDYLSLASELSQEECIVD